MRVYLPATFASLRSMREGGELGPAPLTAFAVTPDLREWYVEGDLEELEYTALAEAARASLRLLDVDLARDPATPPRRVVLAADVPDEHATPAPELDRAVVRLSGALPLRKVVSVHVDGAEAAEDVRVAAEAVVAADLGSEQAQFLVDGAEGHELLWFATQEIDDLLEELA